MSQVTITITITTPYGYLNFYHVNVIKGILQHFGMRTIHNWRIFIQLFFVIVNSFIVLWCVFCFFFKVWIFRSELSEMVLIKVNLIFFVFKQTFFFHSLKLRSQEILWNVFFFHVSNRLKILLSHYSLYVLTQMLIMIGLFATAIFYEQKRKYFFFLSIV